VVSGRRRGGAEQHTGPVHSAAFARDGATFASVGADGLAVVWNARTLQPVKLLSGHGRAVQQVLFGPDGRTLYTIGADGSLLAWDLTGARGAAARVVSGGAGSSLACALAGRDITEDEWRTFLPHRAYRHVCPT
jgi:WD40 repeat protein